MRFCAQNQNFIESFTDKTDFDGNFIKDLLKKSLTLTTFTIFSEYKNIDRYF